MKAKEIMTPSPECCSATDTVQDAARLMRDNDCGVIPIVSAGSDKVIGIITDRDLAIRGYADGKGPDAKVGDLMTASPACCKTTDDVTAVEKTMTENQIRRVPIVDEAGRCVGIVSQADIARASKGDGVTDREVGILVEKISQPGSQPARKTGGAFLEL